MSKRDLLLEIGTEELPPGSLFSLAQALADGLVRELDAAQIKHRDAKPFATPRRIAAVVGGVADRQADQQIQRLGPSIANAYDASGQATKAALGFAASCGVPLEELQQTDGPKGRVLQFVGKRSGVETSTLLANMVNAALRSLPIAKRMRWGSGEEEFVRPIHWIVLLFGSAVVEAEILGVRTGKHSRGHRFHAPGAIAIRSPASYCATLLNKGRVIADADVRRERIRSGVSELAVSLGGEAVIDASLLDEVTALVEWPVPIAGRFDEGYLQLPPEVPIATMQDHQRYFPVRAADGRLMNSFITVANIESRDPQKVRDGNERVVRPRLADAAFFWQTDREQRLEQRREALKGVTFQSRLGSLFDKSERVAALSAEIAAVIGGDIGWARRSAELSKCDLLTAMVGEFPELQGTMGKYYAQHDAEPDEVCAAIEEQYLPRFSGDRLPGTRSGQALSVADKLDSLCGIFCIGQKPSGTRDPYGLRRAAVGILRTAIEGRLELNLRELIDRAVALQPVQASADVAREIWDYVLERLRSAYLESEQPITTEMFDAVIAAEPTSPLDIEVRLHALLRFLELPESASLAGANKRIANILRKSATDAEQTVAAEHLCERAEQRLFERLLEVEQAVDPLFAARDYASGLAKLAVLKDEVDRFFDSVMVMAEDTKLRSNRLALLARIRSLFLRAADLSKLPG